VIDHATMNGGLEDYFCDWQLNSVLPGEEKSIEFYHWGGTGDNETHLFEKITQSALEIKGGLNFPPTTPTNLTCNGLENCNTTIDSSIILNSSGSTDTENDSITYFIEANLNNISTILNTNDITKIAQSGGGGSSDYTGQTCDLAWGFDCAADPETADNTFDACPYDDTNSDERINNIYLNSTTVLITDTIGITCEYYSTETTADEMYLYYRNSSSGTWVQKGTGSTSGIGSTIRNWTTFSIPLDDVVGEHQFRCIIGYTGENDECMNSGYFDNDDINLTVISGGNSETNETNTTETIYQNIGETYNQISEI
jgi:hypothetical protein